MKGVWRDEAAVKVASFALPMIGGVYSVARTLRDSLASRRVEVRWIGVGQRGVQAWNEPGMESQRLFGEVIAIGQVDEKTRAKQVIEHLLCNGYDGVFIDVLGGAFHANIARYLPESLFRILIVHSITPGTYSFARAVRDYVHATVGVSPRIRDDLIRGHGFMPDRTLAIPTGVELNRFECGTRCGRIGTLKVLVLGRIDHAAKGVFDIPRIARLLTTNRVAFTIAGEGPDLPALKKACASQANRISFIGTVAPDAIPRVLRAHDVLLFPSRYEGQGLVLLEAMATGCVPVASNIRGVTDVMVEHGVNGLLFPVGSASKAAEAIGRLADNAALLEELGKSARRSTVARFSVDQMADRYLDLIRTVRSSWLLPARALDIEDWGYPPELITSWRAAIPAPLKGIIRVVLERARSR